MQNQRYMPLCIMWVILVVLPACGTTQYPPAAGEAKWTPASRGQKGGVEIFLDEQSISRVSATTVRLRIKYKYLSPKPFDSGYIEELVVYNEYDCNTKDIYRILWSDAHFVNGETRADRSERQGYLLPDDAVFRFVCE